jgi:hypothetical protein
MDSWKQKMTRATEMIQPESDGLTATYQLARRHQRNRRIRAGALGFAFTIALVTGLLAVLVASHRSSPALVDAALDALVGRGREG